MNQICLQEATKQHLNSESYIHNLLIEESQGGKKHYRIFWSLFYTCYMFYTGVLIIIEITKNVILHVSSYLLIILLITYVKILSKFDKNCIIADNTRKLRQFKVGCTRSNSIRPNWLIQSNFNLFWWFGRLDWICNFENRHDWIGWWICSWESNPI